MALQEDWMRLTLRIPPDLHQRIQMAASQKGQPFNAEVIDVLSKEYPEKSPMADLFRRIWALFEKMDPEKDRETVEELGEVLVDFIVMAAKDNPKLQPFAQNMLEGRAKRELAKGKS